MDTVTIKRGEDLSESDIDQINQAFQRVFPENALLEKGGKDLIGNTFFFIYSQNGEVIATARLRPVFISFMDHSIRTQGIADVISNIPGKGYGKQIIEAVKKYLQDNNQFGLGFCSPHNREFYIKCGLQVEPEGMTRFYYKNDQGELVNYTDDVIYFNDIENFMKEFKEHPEEKVIIPIPHW